MKMMKMMMDREGYNKQWQ